MPKVQRVAKARKSPGECGKCGGKIKVGDPYVWWAFRYGGKRVRCAKPECAPSRSDLTQSGIYQAAWGAQDAASAAISDATSVSDITSAMEDLASSIEEIVNEFDEKIDNIESGFGHRVQMCDDLDDRKSGYESWKDEVEGISLDDIEVEVSAKATDADGEEQEVTVSVDFGDSGFEEGNVIEALKAEQDSAGLKFEEAEYDKLSEALVTAASEAFEEALEERRDEARSAVDNCPE